MGEEKNDVRGKLVIDQMKRYAKRFSDHTGASVNVKIDVWYHPPKQPLNLDPYSMVEFTMWDAAGRRFITPKPATDDLRNLGTVIDEYIKAESGGKKDE